MYSLLWYLIGEGWDAIVIADIPLRRGSCNESRAILQDGSGFRYFFMNIYIDKSSNPVITSNPSRCLTSLNPQAHLPVRLVYSSVKHLL